MSLTIIAIAGVLLGFLCLLVGFFMDTEGRGAAARADNAHIPGHARRVKHVRRRPVAIRKKAA